MEGINKRNFLATWIDAKHKQPDNKPVNWSGEDEIELVRLQKIEIEMQDTSYTGPPKYNAINHTHKSCVDKRTSKFNRGNF